MSSWSLCPPRTVTGFLAVVISYFFFLLPFFSSEPVIAKATPSFASVSLVLLLPYLIFQLYKIRNASATVFGKLSFC